MDNNEKKAIESAIRLLEAEDNNDGLGEDASVALDLLHKLLPKQDPNPEQQKLITQVTLALSKISSIAVHNGLDTVDGDSWYVLEDKEIEPNVLALIKQVNEILP